MDHCYAAENHLVEQYLLNDMSPELRDQFEDHYFGCEICAADLQSTASFLEAARTELQKPQFAIAPPKSNVVPINRSRLLGKPAFALAALAACFLVIVYQNLVVFPSLRSEVASLRAPEILPTVSLAAGNSRGAETPAAPIGNAQAILLQFDIPGQERFAGYTCELFSPQHQLLWSGQVSVQQARDTVSVRVPLAARAIASQPGGDYSLVVKGDESQPDGTRSSVDLATYQFVLKTGSIGSGH